MGKNKHTGIILIVLWLIASGFMIVKNHNTYSLKDYIFVFAVALCPVCIYVVYRVIKKSKKKTDVQHSSSNYPINIKEPTQNPTQNPKQNPTQISNARIQQPPDSIIPKTDGELSFQFMKTHSSEISKYVNAFEEYNRRAYEASSLDEKIRLLNQTINEFEKAKKWFYLSEGGRIYFQTFYEHLHNSRNPCFSYIDPVKDYLEDCLEERDIIIPKIIELASSENGILQKDLYQYFDTSKGEIQRIIKNMENQGIIRKVKKGNTYLITKQ